MTKSGKIKNSEDDKFRIYWHNCIKILKEKVKMPNKTVYYLGIFNFFEYFLCDNKIYIMHFNSKEAFSTDELDLLNIITLLKDDIFDKSDIKLEHIITNDRFKYDINDFFKLLNKPCNITAKIDVPFLEVIKYFRNYKKTDFKTKNFIFYPQKINDYSLHFSITAKNLKTNAAARIYLPYCYDKISTNLRDYVIDDLQNNLTNYQKRICKTEFLECLNEYNNAFQTENYWVLELLTNAVNTTCWLHEWSVHRIFAGQDNKFVNIWVDDFLGFDEKPYFFLTNDKLGYKTDKVAVLDFKEAKYKTKGIYKQNNIKFNFWELDKDYVKELMNYLNSPYEKSRDINAPDIKTNWQKLIYEYNNNTAYSDYETLSLNLKMPNYLELFDG